MGKTVNPQLINAYLHKVLSLSLYRATESARMAQASDLKNVGRRKQIAWLSYYLLTFMLQVDV